MSESCLYICNRPARYSNDLRVHRVFVGILYFHRLKGAGAYVQCHLCRLYAALLKVVQYLLREVQTGSRCCHRTFDARIDGLICCLVALLGFAVEVGRDRQFAYCLQNLGEGDTLIIPGEVHRIGVTLLGAFIRAQVHVARTYCNG